VHHVIHTDNTPVHVHNSEKIKRKYKCMIIFGPTSKGYEIAFKKHSVLDSFISLPCGYEWMISSLIRNKQKSGQAQPRRWN
jgi:hypothetical protein